MTRRPVVFFALFGLSVLGLTVVGLSRRSRLSPVVLVRAAPAHTRSARSAHLLLEVGLRPARGGGSTTVTGDGLVDFARRRSSLTLDLSSLGLDRVDERVLPPRVYLRLVAASSTTTPWMTTGAAALGPLANVDPAAALDYLRGAVTARPVGRRVVGGVATTRYTATVRLTTDVAQQLGVGELGLDVWLDGHDRVARLAYDVDLGRLPRPAGAAVVAGEMRTTLVFDRFGGPVVIDPPPPDQVSLR